MTGKIVKSVAGFFYVDTKENGVYTCRAKGAFRHDGVTPLVGDDVEIDVTDSAKLTGNVVSVNTRKNSLIRPNVANVDQALVVFAAAKPEPNLNLLDRFLISMQKQGIPAVICFNKSDIVSDDEIHLLSEAYSLCGHKVIPMSVLKKQGTDEVFEALRGKTTVLAGPSGVGKSSLMNELCPGANMETGDLSKKIERGKQTTRHTELVKIAEDSFLIDTPGFSSLFVTDIKVEELKNYFPEFAKHEASCRFLSCMHLKEPECGVKEALAGGLISRIRYENYCQLYEELKGQKNY